MSKIKIIADVRMWWDRTYGNTYFSALVTNADTGKSFIIPMQYGSMSLARQEILKELVRRGIIPKKYTGKEYLYERENKYPVYWADAYVNKSEMFK